MGKYKVRNQIYETTDYKIFKVLTGNRDVQDKHVRDVERSYEKVGQLDIPILVNKDMEVIEGQHRLEACKRKHLPVYFTIQKDRSIGLDECQALNVNTANWKLEDYIDSYAKQGVKSYLFLKQLGDLHPKSSLNDKAAALFRVAKISSGVIKKGNLNITETQLNLADKTLEWVEPIMDNFDRKDFRGARSYLSIALCLCYNYAQDHKIDLPRLERIVVEKLNRSNTWANVETCIQEIENCYNHGLSGKNKILIYNIFREDRLNNKSRCQAIFKKA